MTDMYALKNELLKVLEFIEDKGDVVYVDYPLHHNVGDLLIFLGTLSFFKNNSINVRKKLSNRNTDIKRLKKYITPKTTILCHGGGNFGDIYPAHQILREELIRTFPNNRVIILPQTAFFKSLENQEKSEKIFKKHNNLIMFARDKKTYEIFQKFSVNTYLMPDMAHELYETLPRSEIRNGIFYFLRKDIEKTPLPLNLQKEIQSQDYYDWSDLVTKNDNRVLYAVNKLIRVNAKLKSSVLDEVIFKTWEVHSRVLVARMSKYFSSYQKIVTSRLHGHILSCLLDIPSTLIDNSYGKNLAYYDLWMKDLKITSLWEK